MGLLSAAVPPIPRKTRSVSLGVELSPRHATALEHGVIRRLLVEENRVYVFNLHTLVTDVDEERGMPVPRGRAAPATPLGHNAKPEELRANDNTVKAGATGRHLAHRCAKVDGEAEVEEAVGGKTGVERQIQEALEHNRR